MSQPLKPGAWNIPPNWAWIDIASAADTTSGGTPRRDRAEYYGGQIPWLKSGELRDRTVFEVEEYITEEGLRNSNAKVFSPGTLCIALYGATVGKLAILGVGSATNQAICGIFPATGIDPRFLFRFFELIRPELIELGKGGAQPNISQGIVRSTFFPLAPSNEQSRIVAEIEKQFTRLDAAVAALKRARANLKRYRAAVLKAACEGRLVPTEAELARKEGRTYETGEQLLARILKERRAKWEADQPAKMRASGKPPENDEWRKRYREPKPPDMHNQPNLPEGWTWASLDQLAWYVRNGISTKPDHSEGLAILRISAVKPMKVDLQDVRFLKDKPEYHEYELDGGDLLFTRYNGTREFVGICGLVPTDIGVLVHPDKLIRVRPVLNHALGAYIAIASNTGHSRTFVERRIRTTAGQSGVSGEDVRGIPIPLCPLSEQTRIVAEVHARLSAVDAAQLATGSDMTRSDRLRQSILKRAFEGKLVPQDPNDEPASALLERIRAERAAQAQSAKRVPRPKRAKFTAVEVS